MRTSSKEPRQQVAIHIFYIAIYSLIYIVIICIKHHNHHGLSTPCSLKSLLDSSLSTSIHSRLIRVFFRDFSSDVSVLMSHTALHMGNNASKHMDFGLELPIPQKEFYLANQVCTKYMILLVTVSFIFLALQLGFHFSNNSTTIQDLR